MVLPLLTIVAKLSILDICGGPGYVSSLRKKCPYSELFPSAFSHIRSEYGEILRISPYSVRIQEKADQNNSENGHFSRSLTCRQTNKGQNG